MTNAAKSTTTDFDLSVLPHLGTLRAAANRYCKGHQDQAEDLVQETLCKALRAWDSFEAGRGGARAWLHTILRNTFLNDYSKRKRRARMESEVSAQARDRPAVAVANSLSAAPGPMEATEAARVKALLRDALATLRPDYRDAIRMADYEGRSYQEIADAMGCKLGTVMSRLYRGRQELGLLLGGSLDNVVEIGDWR